MGEQRIEPEGARGVHGLIAVFLSGGMRSNWQDTVIRAFEDMPYVKFIDPSKHGLTNEYDYVPWDIAGVMNADYVFAYMEADNPGGHGLCFETGFANGEGTPVLFVDQSSENVRRQFAFVRLMSAFCTNHLEDGIKELRRWCEIKSELFVYPIVNME